MADLDIKFGPNRSCQNLAQFAQGLRNAITHAIYKKKLAAPNELKFVGKYSQVMSHLHIKFEPNRS
jgi:hypothetical protein